MKYHNFLANKFFKKGKRGYISFISNISVIGITVGVAALIIILSVMNGFSSDLKDKVIGTRAHIYLSSLFGPIHDYEKVIDKVKNNKEIIGISPVSSSEIMIKNGDSVNGGILFGVDRNTVEEVIKFKKYMVLGHVEDLSDDGVILGEELAFSLNATLGESITVISPKIKVMPDGSIFPKTKKLIVEGIIKTGMYEYDKSFLYTTLKNFDRLFEQPENSTTAIYIKVKNVYETKKVIKQLSKELPKNLFSRDWIDMNHNLFTALRTEKFVMGLILFIIVLVAGINIIITIIMMVQEKKKEVGILRSLGIKRSGIKRIFLLQGIYMGSIGTLLGSVIGVLVVAAIKIFHVKIPGGGSVYYIDILPVQFKVWPDFILIVVGVMVVTILFSLIPSAWASKLDPIKAIKDE
ncbi:ABC transporter permease [bacterium]|nr:ABC transporter permease [bacterium]